MNQKLEGQTKRQLEGHRRRAHGEAVVCRTVRLVAREAQVHAAGNVEVARESNRTAGLNDRSEDVLLSSPALFEVLLVTSEIACADTGVKLHAFGSSEVILHGKAVACELVASDLTAVGMDAVRAGAINGEVQSPIRRDKVTQTG